MAVRTERIDLRMTAEEKAKLFETAAAVGLTVTELVISMCIGDKLGSALKRSAD